jgi:hypothetical protein
VTAPGIAVKKSYRSQSARLRLHTFLSGSSTPGESSVEVFVLEPRPAEPAGAPD